VLARFPIRGVVGARRSLQACLGVAIELVRRRRPEDLLAPRAQMTRQNKLQCGPFRPRSAQTFPVSGNSPLDDQCDVGESSVLSGTRVSPVLPVARPAPTAGFCFSGLFCSRTLTMPPACRYWRRRAVLCSSVAESLAPTPAKTATVAYLVPNQPLAGNANIPVYSALSQGAAGSPPDPLSGSFRPDGDFKPHQGFREAL